MPVATLLALKTMPNFNVMDAPARDDARAAGVFAGCWLRHRCHLLHAGRFYKCTRPPHLADVWSWPELRDDGITLDATPDALRGRLLDYLETAEPLASCAVCTGAAGGEEVHRQLAPEETRHTKGSGFPPTTVGAPTVTST